MPKKNGTRALIGTITFSTLVAIGVAVWQIFLVPISNHASDIASIKTTCADLKATTNTLAREKADCKYIDKGFSDVKEQVQKLETAVDKRLGKIEEKQQSIESTKIAAEAARKAAEETKESLKRMEDFLKEIKKNDNSGSGGAR